MSTTIKIVYAGIDVSKGYTDIIALEPNKDIAEPAFRLYDTPEGHQQLRSLIDKWLEMGFENIYCGVESTGGYENNWVNYLQELGRTEKLIPATVF